MPHWLVIKKYMVVYKVKVKTIAPVLDHFSAPHLGAQILSMSKRIMNEVMCLAEDNEIDIFYQDTDSMHLYECFIPKLSELFEKEYGRKLIGKEMGQFHSDFEAQYEGKSLKNVVSVELIAPGKKTYCDRLQGEDENGIIRQVFHIRSKGISESTMWYQANKDYKGDVMAVYKDLNDGKEVSFDMNECDKKSRFTKNKDMSWSSWINEDRPLHPFIRKLCFK